MNNNITMKQDCLQRLSDTDISQLLEVLQQDLPASTVVYHWLLIQQNWSHKIPGVQIHVLCPRGDWSNATVVAFTQGLALEDKVYGVVYARNDDELSHVLLSTRAIPWRRVSHFSGVLQRHVSAVTEAATRAGVTLPFRQASPCHLVLFDDVTVEQFKNVEIPSKVGKNVLVRKLRGEDIDQVWNLRPVFDLSYKPVIKACLEHNITSGVFVCEKDGSQILASMVLQTPYGGMGMGASHPRYLKHGYHALANAHIMSAMSKTKFQLHGHVQIDNDIIFNFSQKYGMKIVGGTQRVDINPGHYKPHL